MLVQLNTAIMADIPENELILQKELEELLNVIEGNKKDLYFPSLKDLATKIQQSTSSMTSVPMPLKYLKQHFEKIKGFYKKMPNKETKQLCANIISILATVIEKNGDCLKYRMLCDLNDDIEQWGHEYILHLSDEISTAWHTSADSKRKDYLKIIERIIAFNLHHNREVDMCDLLMEIEKFDIIHKYVDEESYPKICQYLQSCISYVSSFETAAILTTLLKLSEKFKKNSDAVKYGLMLNDIMAVEKILFNCLDQSEMKQLAFILARNRRFIDLGENDTFDEMKDIMSNRHLNQQFLSLCRDLDILEPKTPEDVYKNYLDSLKMVKNINSAMQNLASSFVNGFVNAGFGTDKLLTEDGNKWLYKNKDEGMLSTIASLGLIFLWDADCGLTPIDKYLYSIDDNIKAGALLACGIVNVGLINEIEPALALLSDYITSSNNKIQTCAILGIGLAYAGTNKTKALELLFPLLKRNDNNFDIEIIGITSLAIGMIALGTGNSELVDMLMEVLYTLTDIDCENSYVRFFFLGIGLIYFNQPNKIRHVTENFIESSTTKHKLVEIIIETCAYAGSGNVLIIQKILQICSVNDVTEIDGDTKSMKNKNSLIKEISVIGLAIIAMGEDIGSQMILRIFNCLLCYGDKNVRKAVSLAYGLIFVSNPKTDIMDKLSKLSHDSDICVASNAIFALGLIGAGTNNARLASILRQLAMYYSNDPKQLFLVRIAQGFLHMGKGTLTFNPFTYDRCLMLPVAIAGLLIITLTMMDSKTFFFGQHAHYLLYCITLAIQPKMLVTLDEDLNPLPVPVRVGIAVDIVGQAGNPKSITGFLTQVTPVLLGTSEKAELATDDYTPLTPTLEGFVILRKNQKLIN